jgi:hypothetical protein
MQIGAFKIPEIFVKEAEDYLNKALLTEIERKVEYSIETAVVKNDSISLMVRKK